MKLEPRDHTTIMRHKICVALDVHYFTLSSATSKRTPEPSLNVAKVLQHPTKKA